jgi:hypothetical protein
MEASFGADLGHVRVHTGGEAAASARGMEARAYTIGSDIVFGSGEYAPATGDGKRLLAHELAHTAQQLGSAEPRPAAKLEVSQPGDTIEMEADRAAESVMEGRAVQGITPGVPQIAREPAGAAKPAGGDAELKTTTVLPFRAKQPGEGGGWDSDTILKTSMIPVGSEAGKAVMDGPDKVSEISLRMAKQLAAELKATKQVNEYWAALFQASVTCSLFSVSITLINATYGDLNHFAVLSNILAKSGEERRNGLIAWSRQPEVAAPAVKAKEEVKAEAPADTAPAPASPNGAPVNSAFRTAILAELEKWKGAHEGDNATFDREFPQSMLYTQRMARKGQPLPYSTCIEFEGRVLAHAVATLKDKDVVNAVGTNAEIFASRIDKAWNAAKPNMKERPRTGDMYVLNFAKNHPQYPNYFSHTGYFISLTVNPPGTDGKVTETWETVDGGAGTSTRYNAAGKMIDQQGNETTTPGQEAIANGTRVYHPENNEITGQSNHGTDLKVLHGWVDIEKLLKDKGAAPVAPQPKKAAK